MLDFYPPCISIVFLNKLYHDDPFSQSQNRVPACNYPKYIKYLDLLLLLYLLLRFCSISVSFIGCPRGSKLPLP
jgi:hypothetical protein